MCWKTIYTSSLSALFYILERLFHISSILKPPVLLLACPASLMVSNFDLPLLCGEESLGALHGAQSEPVVI